MSSSGVNTEQASVVLGTALVLLGVAAYVLSDFASMTALIPVAFGILVVFLARLAQAGRYRQMAIYAIGLLGLLGILGSIRVVPDVLDQTWNIATLSQVGMIILSLGLLVIVALDIRDNR